MTQKIIRMLRKLGINIYSRTEMLLSFEAGFLFSENLKASGIDPEASDVKTGEEVWEQGIDECETDEDLAIAIPFLLLDAMVKIDNNNKKNKPKVKKVVKKKKK